VLRAAALALFREMAFHSPKRKNWKKNKVAQTKKGFQLK